MGPPTTRVSHLDPAGRLRRANIAGPSSTAHRIAPCGSAARGGPSRAASQPTHPAAGALPPTTASGVDAICGVLSPKTPRNGGLEALDRNRTLAEIALLFRSGRGSHPVSNRPARPTISGGLRFAAG